MSRIINILLLGLIGTMVVQGASVETFIYTVRPKDPGRLAIGRNDFKALPRTNTAAAALGELKKLGDAVLLWEEVKPLIAGVATFDQDEAYTLTLFQKHEGLPPVIRLNCKFSVNVKPAGNGDLSFKASGMVEWSPELARRLLFQARSSFASISSEVRASTLQGEAMPLFQQLFLSAPGDGAVFKYPTLKHAHIDLGRIVKAEEPVLLTQTSSFTTEQAEMLVVLMRVVN